MCSRRRMRRSGWLWWSGMQCNWNCLKSSWWGSVDFSVSGTTHFTISFHYREMWVLPGLVDVVVGQLVVVEIFESLGAKQKSHKSFNKTLSPGFNRLNSSSFHSYFQQRQCQAHFSCPATQIYIYILLYLCIGLMVVSQPQPKLTILLVNEGEKLVIRQYQLGTLLRSP